MKSVKSLRVLGGLLASLLVVFTVFLGAAIVSTLTVIAQDTTAPEIEHDPVTQGWVDNPIVITANVTDDVAVDEVRLNYTNVTGDELNETMTPQDGNYTYSIPAPSSAGTIEYFIWASDTSGNENRTANSTIVVDVDATAPVIDHLPVTEGWVNNTIAITATVTDNAVVDEVRLNYTNVTGDEFNETMTADGDTYSYTIPAPSSAGTIEYFIWANDTSDNEVRIANSTITVEFDTEAPEITHTPVTSANVGEEFNISAIVTDNAAVAQVNISYTDVNGDSHNVSMTLVTGDTYNHTIPAQSSEGTLTYFIWANDTSGNVNMTDSNDVTIAAVEVDTEDPVITHEPVESATAGKDVKIEAKITDNIAVEIATLYYRKKGETYTSIAMSATDHNYTATIPASAVTTEGVEYYITATDAAANEARSPETGAHEIEVTEEAEIPWLWIIIAIIVIIIIIAIVAAAARRKGPEIPEEEEAPPEVEERPPEESEEGTF